MSKRTSGVINALNDNVEKAGMLSSRSETLKDGSNVFNNNARGLSSKLRRQQEQGVVRGAAHYLLKRIRRLRGITQRGTSSRGGKKRTFRKKANKRKTKKAIENKRRDKNLREGF